MAIDLSGKKKSTQAIADALAKRYGGAKNNKKPGYKPAPTAKLVPQKNGVKVKLKF